MIDRRTFLAAFALAAGTGSSLLGRQSFSSQADFGPILAGLGAGARLGVAALDTGSGRRLVHDAHGLYAMCSTFKLALAAAILAEVDRGALRLDQEIPFGPSDMIFHAPAAQAALERGRMSVEQMCAAIVEVSDNVAANLLLRRIGGPAGLTAFFRRCGDEATRLDRYELELNSNLPGDPRDTTTPAAMIGLMRAVLLGDVLAPASRARLIGWMERCATGLERLRAGLPLGWRAGDKTGTGARGAANDIAIAFPPGRDPILIACYLSAPEASPAERNAAHASVARLVSQSFT